MFYFTPIRLLKSYACKFLTPNSQSDFTEVRLSSIKNAHEIKNFGSCWGPRARYRIIKKFKAKMALKGHLWLFFVSVELEC